MAEPDTLGQTKIKKRKLSNKNSSKKSRKIPHESQQSNSTVPEKINKKRDIKLDAKMLASKVQRCVSAILQTEIK